MEFRSLTKTWNLTGFPPLGEEYPGPHDQHLTQRATGAPVLSKNGSTDGPKCILD